MNETKCTYDVVIPKLGLPNNEFTVVRTTTPEMAGEVVRILFAANDPEVTWIRVERKPIL